jgi:hypothetical protein
MQARGERFALPEKDVFMAVNDTDLGECNTLQQERKFLLWRSTMLI